MDAATCAALVATLNAMTPDARKAVLATMTPQARAQLLAAGLIDDANVASASVALREARLADLARLEAERKSAVWAEANTCFAAFNNALLHTGFAKCGGELAHWRSAFRDVLSSLKRMDEEADGLASKGMPTVEADAELVRAPRKALRKSIETDLENAEKLIKACDELGALFRTLGLFQGAPMAAAPSV